MHRLLGKLIKMMILKALHTVYILSSDWILMPLKYQDISGVGVPVAIHSSMVFWGSEVITPTGFRINDGGTAKIYIIKNRIDCIPFKNNLNYLSFINITIDL